MAVESKRGCGYRPQGATYLVADGPGYPCGRMPIPLIPCPLCNHRPPFTRGLAKITPKEILVTASLCKAHPGHCQICPLNKAMSTETAGLVWCGDRFYTPEEFTAEARQLGISRRIPWPAPRWLEIGKTWVFVAHPAALTERCEKCVGQGRVRQPLKEVNIDGIPQTNLFTEAEVQCEECEGSGKVPAAAVFHAFVPTRIERIIVRSMPADEREKLVKQGLTLVEVPDGDPDHAPKKRKGDE